jgi:hypothetical protein
MGYVIWGHGGLDPSDTAKMETVALSAGTTLQFYADAGQGLIQNRKLLASFAELPAPWPPISDTGVTYNLGLAPFSDKELEILDGENAGWDGHTLLTVGKNLGAKPQLCTGDESTCPKDPRMVAGTVSGPRAHTCDGILGVYAGQELFWVACTSIDGFSDEAMGAVTTARGEAPENVRIGSDPDSVVANALAKAGMDPDGFPAWFDQQPDNEKAIMLRDPGLYAWDQGRDATQTQTEASNWVPTDRDIAIVSEGNQSYVKDGAEDYAHPWEIGGALVLLGNEHDASFHSWVQSCPDYQSGTFEIKRATFGAGKIVFAGVSGPLQGTVESMVEGFSDKKVVFE